MQQVVHVMTVADHATWRRGEAWKPASLTKEGFVHLCFPSQVEMVRARFYANVPIVVAVLDMAKLGSPLVVEDSYGHGAYPHLYGPIPATAVVKFVTLKAGETLKL